MSPAASHGQARSEALADGQITKIDVSAQKITIRHGPLKQFDMDEPMTMVFRAANPEMLKTVKAGDKVKFLPERIKRTVHRSQRSKKSNDRPAHDENTATLKRAGTLNESVSFRRAYSVPPEILEPRGR